MTEIIAAVRRAIPNAASAPPGAVLEHVLGVRLYSSSEPVRGANVIDCGQWGGGRIRLRGP
jgi:hypothetical protein